jgi:RNA polymerase sigma-70 factor (ECF subfamily)
MSEETSDGIRKLDRFIKDELDELNRALVILYLDGNSHETIAEVLGISSTSVGTRIGRIKQQLRQYFDRARRD